MTAENEVQLLECALYQRVDYKKSISDGKGEKTRIINLALAEFLGRGYETG
jgi:hypothetical protein